MGSPSKERAIAGCWVSYSVLGMKKARPVCRALVGGVWLLCTRWLGKTAVKTLLALGGYS